MVIMQQNSSFCCSSIMKKTDSYALGCVNCKIHLIPCYFFFCTATLVVSCNYPGWYSKTFVTSCLVFTLYLVLVRRGLFRPFRTGFDTREKPPVRSGLPIQGCSDGFEAADVSGPPIKLNANDSTFTGCQLSWRASSLSESSLTSIFTSSSVSPMLEVSKLLSSWASSQ